MLLWVHKLKITYSRLSQLNAVRAVKHAYTFCSVIQSIQSYSRSLLRFSAWFKLIFHCSQFNIPSTLLWPQAASNCAADSVYNVAPAPISKFRGSWFSHITTQRPQNVRPPWAALLNCFTGAKIPGYICVCETLKLMQQIHNWRYMPLYNRRRVRDVCGWSAIQRDEITIYVSKQVVKNCSR